MVEHHNEAFDYIIDLSLMDINATLKVAGSSPALAKTDHSYLAGDHSLILSQVPGVGSGPPVQGLANLCAGTTNNACVRVY